VYFFKQVNALPIVESNITGILRLRFIRRIDRKKVNLALRRDAGCPENQHSRHPLQGEIGAVFTNPPITRNEQIRGSRFNIMVAD